MLEDRNDLAVPVGLLCHLINKAKHTLQEPIQAQCGPATREDWNTVSDPGAGSSEVIA